MVLINLVAKNLASYLHIEKQAHSMACPLPYLLSQSGFRKQSFK